MSTFQQLQPSSVEVLIRGNGPGAWVCASILADLGHDVCVAACASEKDDWIELLSPSAMEELSILNGFANMSSCMGQSCRGILDLWNPEQVVFTDFELMQCRTGTFVTRSSLAAALRKHAIARGVRCVCSTSPVTATITKGRCQVGVGIGGIEHRIDGRFIIDATGSKNSVRSRDFSRRIWIDRLIGVQIWNDMIAGFEDRMLLSLSSCGWWYLCPAENGSCQAIMMTDGDLLPKEEAERMSFLKQEFYQAFRSITTNTGSGHRTGRVRDARTSCRRRLWHDRWLPIGDAAYSIDPLAGSGITRAIAMAREAAHAVSSFLRTQSSNMIQAIALKNLSDFSESLAAIPGYYSYGASIYPESTFWFRRLGSVSRASSGIA